MPSGTRKTARSGRRGGEKVAETTSVKIIKMDERAFLEINGNLLELADYSLESTLYGETELKAIFLLDAGIMECSIEAKKESYLQQR